MRRTLGQVLIGTFGFLAMSALLLYVYVPGQVKKTPVNVDTYTYLTGTAAYLSEASGPVKALSHTVGDAKQSTGGVVVFQSFTCLMRDPNGTAPNCTRNGDATAGSLLINASDETFATNRRTAMAVPGTGILPAGGPSYSGLINKWPFDAQRTAYPYWDGVLGKAVTAAYAGEETIDGLATYKYHVLVSNQPAEVASGIQGTYSDDKTIWIDPVTGSIINQQEHQLRTLDTGDNALNLTLAFTDKTVAKNVADTKDKVGQLSLLSTAPNVLVVLSLIALVAGVLLLRTGTTGAPSAAHAKEKVSS